MTLFLAHALRSAPRRALPLLAVLAALIAFNPAAAHAQTDLAAENEKLKQEVLELRQQRDALTQRVRDLNAEITKLRAEVAKLQKSPGSPSPTGAPGAPGTPGTPGSPTPLTSAPANPFASPDALFATLQNEYQEKFGAMERTTRSDLSRYQREVASWTRAAQRERRAPVEWTITVMEPTAAGDRPAKLVFQVLDTASGQPISQTASALLPSRWTRDIAAAKVGDKWKLSATMTASPSYNAQRETAGTPDEPRLIGPFAEFGFELAITQLTPAP